MKAYWDTSALVNVILGHLASVSAFDQAHQRITRSHALAETFSQLTGGKLKDEHGEPFRLDADDAAEAIGERAKKMTVLSLSGEQTLKALQQARKRGVRGGAIHDYLHVFAAELGEADRIYTFDSDLAAISNVPAVEP